MLFLHEQTLSQEDELWTVCPERGHAQRIYQKQCIHLWIDMSAK